MNKRDCSKSIDLMHDDDTGPEGSMGVLVTLKSKMAASSASSGGNSKVIVSFDLSESSSKSPERLLDSLATSDQNTFQHYCHLDFPLRGNTDIVRDYHNARLSRESILFYFFYIIMHKVYCFLGI